MFPYLDYLVTSLCCITIYFCLHYLDTSFPSHVITQFELHCLYEMCFYFNECFFLLYLTVYFWPIYSCTLNEYFNCNMNLKNNLLLGQRTDENLLKLSRSFHFSIKSDKICIRLLEGLSFHWLKMCYWKSCSADIYIKHE